VRHKGEWLSAERQRRRLSVRQLVVAAGFKHVAEGHRRIVRFERTGNEVRPFVERLPVRTLRSHEGS
jgi:hypothetical protein